MIGDVRRFSLRGLRGSCLQRVTLLAAMKPKQDLRVDACRTKVRHLGSDSLRTRTALQNAS
jgi:hypothetical protein